MTQRSTLKSFDAVRNHPVFAPIFQDIDRVAELAGRDFFCRHDLELPTRMPLADHFDLTAAIHRRWQLESRKGRRAERSRWKTARALEAREIAPDLRQNLGVRDGFHLDTRYLFRRWKSGPKPPIEEAKVDARRIRSVSLKITGITCLQQTDDAGWSLNSDDIALKWMFLDPDGTRSVHPREGLEFIGHFFSGDRQEYQSQVHTFPVPELVQTPLLLQSYLQLVELDQGGAEDASTENFRTMVEIANQVAEQILRYYVDPLIRQGLQDLGLAAGAAIGGVFSGPGGVVGGAIGMAIGAVAGAVATYFVDKIAKTVLDGLVEPLVEAWQDDLFDIYPFHVLLGRTMFDAAQPPTDDSLEIVGAGGRYKIDCRIEYGTVPVPPPLIQSLSVVGASALNLEIQDLYDPAAEKCPGISAIEYTEFPRQVSVQEKAHLDAFCADCRQSSEVPGNSRFDLPVAHSLPPCMNPFSGERCPKGTLPRKAKLVNFKDLAIEIKPVPFNGAVACTASCKIVRPGSVTSARSIQLGGRKRFLLSEFVELKPFSVSDFQDGSALQIEVEIRNALAPDSKSRKTLLLSPNTIAHPVASAKPPRQWRGEVFGTRL